MAYEEGATATVIADYFGYKLVYTYSAPELLTYEGEALQIVVEVKGLPGLTPHLVKAVTTWGSLKNVTILLLNVNQDSQALFDRYKVEILAHGSPFPFLVVAVLLTMLIAAGAIAFIAWRLTMVQMALAKPTPYEDALTTYLDSLPPSEVAKITPEKMEALVKETAEASKELREGVKEATPELFPGLEKYLKTGAIIVIALLALMALGAAQQAMPRPAR